MVVDGLLVVESMKRVGTRQVRELSRVVGEEDRDGRVKWSSHGREMTGLLVPTAFGIAAFPQNGQPGSWEAEIWQTAGIHTAGQPAAD